MIPLYFRINLKFKLSQFSKKSLSFHNCLAIKRFLTPKTAWINLYLSESWCVSIRTHRWLNVTISINFETRKYLLFINTPRFACQNHWAPSPKIYLFSLQLCFSVIPFNSLDVGHLGWTGSHPYLGLFLHRGKMVFSSGHSSFFLRLYIRTNKIRIRFLRRTIFSIYNIRLVQYFPNCVWWRRC